jgi:hypothetical protein
MKSGQSCRVVIPVDLRPLFDQQVLAGLESDKAALAAVWGLLEGQQNREALFHNLLMCAWVAHECARTWHKPLGEMTHAELREHYSRPRPNTPAAAAALAAAGEATKTASSLKEQTADDPELAAVSDDTIRVNTKFAELLTERGRAADDLSSDLARNFQPVPAKKTPAAWRLWLGCVLCRWFMRHLKRPHRAQAGALANCFFYDCPGTVDPDLLSRNYDRSRLTI